VASKTKAAASSKPVAKATKPAKPAASAPTKAPAKAAAKTVAKAPAKAVAPKAVTKTVTKAAPAKAAPAKKAPAKAAPAKKVPAKAAPAKKAAPQPVVPAKAAAPAVGKATKVAVSVAQSAAPAAPPVIEPTPRPLGKRAAKKVMMEQMAQPESVPTHAPDAAKATFSLTNEPVMTAPVPTPVQKDPKRANNWKTLPIDQLTDQDVLAMPEDQYMNDVQLAYFRLKLNQLKNGILANAGETTEHLREDTVVVPDPADRATIEEEHALELRTRDRERKLLKKIEQAIARIDSGDYGYCEETGEPIGVGRLMARPTASLSLEAQQRRELKQKMFGD
jgi:DnaK suppressor protein